MYRKGIVAGYSLLHPATAMRWACRNIPASSSPGWSFQIESHHEPFFSIRCQVNCIPLIHETLFNESGYFFFAFHQEKSHQWPTKRLMVILTLVLCNSNYHPAQLSLLESAHLISAVITSIAGRDYWRSALSIHCNVRRSK